MLAVSPRFGSNTDSNECSSVNARKSDSKVGLYATGEDEVVQDDLEWIPDELLEQNEPKG